MTFFQFLKTLAVLVLIQYILLMLFMGCISSEEKRIRDSEYNCPGVVWKYYPTARPDDKDDWFHEQSARRGCIRYYGAGACLVSMTKTGDRSYYAMCRRKM